MKVSDYTLVCALNLNTDRTILVQIGSGMTVPAILDSGANQVSLIPKRVLNEVIKPELDDLKLVELDQPILIKLGDNKSTVEVFETVTLDIKILTQAGRVLVTDRRFLVWDVPGDEIILGSDILQSLGIDPYNAINDLACVRKKQAGLKNSMEPVLSNSEIEVIQSSIDRAIERANHSGLNTHVTL